MSISQTNMIAKIAAVVAGFGLVAMSFASFAVPAKAATTDLQSQIAALQAQLAALMAQAGGSTGSSTTFNVNLTVGSRGADVTALQNWLIGQGDGMAITAGATGYFGNQTKAALAAWQSKNGITPAVGYFGPITRAKVNALGGTGTTSTGGTSTSGLTGGAGKLKNVDELGDVNSDLHEGDAATKVIGFSADANGSDVAVQRVDVTLTIATNGSASASINKYVDTVAIYQDGKKLGSMAASAGDKSGRVWTYRFSDINGVIKENNTGNFYIEVTPVSSIGTPESGTNITPSLGTDSVRAIDAEGVSETYTPTGSTGTFSVTTATTGTLSINEASDNPKATTVKADLNNTTDDVTLAAFNLKAKNTDIIVHSLPVNIIANAVKLNDYVQTVKLMKGSTVLKSKSISSTGTSQEVLFDNIDQTISKDSSQEYTVVATIRKIDSGNTFASGDSLSATTTNDAQWDVEDAGGTTVSPSGALTGNSITFQSTGITVTKTDASYNKTVGSNAGEGDKTQYSISFKVTAGDADLYMARLIAASTTPTLGSYTTWATTTSSGGASVIAPGYATNLSVGDTNSSDATNFFKIPSGTSRTFTLNVTLTASSTGFTGVQLTGIGYGTAVGGPAGSQVISVGTTTFTSGLDTFKTADVSMTTH